MSAFEQFTNNNKFTLNYLTLADFIISETSHYIENIFPNLYKRYESLNKIRNEF
jgi:hypothetical protein